ncbi:MAG: aldo/keto reductase [Alphaproteobacteria bacterium]|nr:aldo/keto reductase [Alphaproteobacteria bacterium]
MQYRQLGASDLKVSEIALGSWLTYGAGVETAAATACVKRAFDCGINFIDTANIYGRGAAETFLGQALKDIPRSSYVLATKLYFPMSASDSGLSRAQILKQIDLSLRRLQTDYVDLYQCHRYDNGTPLEETMRALTDVVKAGKARWIGFSEWPAAKIRAVQKMAGVTRFVSSQPEYSLLERGPEADVFPYCARNGIGQIVFCPLAQGVLTGKYKPGQPPPADSRAKSRSMGGFFPNEYLKPKAIAAIEGLRPIAAGIGLSMAQLALAWVLRLPGVSSAIIGATKPEQVADNAAAAGKTIPPEALAAIEHALGPVLAP